MVFLACKRCVDVVLALALLVFLAPLLGAIALLVAWDSPGPIIFRQERVGVRMGRDGRPTCLCSFTMYKFRTMKHNASTECHQQFMKAFIENDEEALQEIQGGDTTESSRYKIMNDERVTRIGAVLRKSSLDELPQLVNVLKGDMSLIGPRPALPYEVAMYKDWHLKRLQIKPGLTGLWQVVGRSSVSFDEMVNLDIEYIEHCSAWLDIKILLLTPFAALSGRGAK